MVQTAVRTSLALFPQSPNWELRGPEPNAFPDAEDLALIAQEAAHDLNNLLTVIQGSCELLRREVPSRNGSRELLEQIDCASQQAKELTAQLQALTSQCTMPGHVQDLQRLLRGAAGMVRSLLTDRHQVEFDLAAGPQMVQLRSGHIERILINLALNAREAMTPPGTLRLSTELVEVAPTSSLARHLVPGPHIRLTVSDTGPGLPESVRCRLFRAFHSTKGAGRGLGLAIVHRLVQGNGGHIDVVSEPGKGTAFHLYFPILERAPAGVLPMPNALSPPATILLVEDEPMVRSVYRRLLASAGYQVLEADDAGQALARAKDTSRVIHLLITDLSLPALPGPELAEQIRASHPGARVLFLSGLFAGLAADASPGNFEFLPKPCRPEVFLQKVKEILDRKGEVTGSP